MLFRSSSSGATEAVPELPSTEEVGDNNDDDHDDFEKTLRRSGRDWRAPQWYGNPVLTVLLLEHGEPENYKEAMAGPESEKWLEAIKSEMGSMYDNQVWTLVDIPEGRKAVENKWIFKKKTDADGNVTVYKARLVAKGFRQEIGRAHV